MSIVKRESKNVRTPLLVISLLSNLVGLIVITKSLMIGPSAAIGIMLIGIALILLTIGIIWKPAKEEAK